MADEELKLVATLVDNVSGPLKDVEGKLRDFGGRGRTGPVQDVSNKFGELGQVAQKAGDTIKSGVAPLLTNFGIASMGAAAAVGALAMGFDKWAKNANSLKYASSEIGLSANTLYQFQQAADQLGLEEPTQKLAAFADKMVGVQRGWGESRRYFAQAGIEDLYAGLRHDLNNPEWDRETRMEKAAERVGNYIKVLADQGRWQEANKLAKDFFGGAGAQEVIDLMEKRNELQKQGVGLSEDQKRISAEYVKLVGEIRGAWQSAVVAAAPFFGRLIELMGGAEGFRKDIEQIASLFEGLTGKSTPGGDTWQDKLLKAADPRLYEQYGSKARAEATIARAPEEKREELRKEYEAGQRKGAVFEAEYKRQALEQWGAAPAREVAPEVREQLEAKGVIGTPEQEKAKEFFGYVPGPEVSNAGRDVGSSVVDGVKQSEDAAAQAGKSIGERIAEESTKGFLPGVATIRGTALGLADKVAGWFRGGRQATPEQTEQAKAFMGVQPEAETAAEPPPAFMKGEGWAAAEVGGEPSPFAALQVPEGQQPIELPPQQRQLEPSPELSSLMKTYGQQDVQPQRGAEFSALAAHETDAPMTSEQVVAPQQGFNWDGFQYDRMGAALAQETKVTGEATVTVDVNAPQGTKVGGKATGMFKQYNIKHGKQMSWSSDSPMGDDWA